MKKTILITPLSTAIFLLAIQAHIPAAFAKEAGFAVYPPLITIHTQAPIELKIPIQIVNTADTPLTITTRFIPFLKSNETSSLPDYSLDQKTSQSLLREIQNIASLKDGDVPANTIALDPRQKKSLTLLVHVPRLYKTTDYYFTTLFTAADATPLHNQSDDRTQTEQQLAVSTHILLAIGPQTNTDLALKSFFPGRHIVTSGTVPFLVKLINNGEHVTQVEGNIAITNLITRQVTNIPLQTTNLLKGDIRILSSRNKAYIAKDEINTQNTSDTLGTITWKPLIILGIYKAELTVISGEQQIPLASVLFLGLPLRGIAMIVILLLLFLLVKRRISKTRNKNEI